MRFWPKQIAAALACFAYDREVLQTMPPSAEHQWINKPIGRIIEAVTEKLGILIRSADVPTLKSQIKHQGIQPDGCYCVANEERVRKRGDLDQEVGPPELTVEGDITATSTDELGIYWALGVPEVRVCGGARIVVYQLQAQGKYSRQPRSTSFPLLPLERIERFLQERNACDETTWSREFRDWVRAMKP